MKNGFYAEKIGEKPINTRLSLKKVHICALFSRGDKKIINE